MGPGGQRDVRRHVMAVVPKLTVDEAILAHHEERYAAAFANLKSWAYLGNSSAFMMLGFMYDSGQGTRRNKKLAIYWYKRAAEDGDGGAATNLATVYRDSGNAKLEFYWYKRAVDLGDDDALVDLGIRYLSGKGVRRNAAAAARCFSKALRSEDNCEASRDTARQMLWGCRKLRRDA
jgi:TPR repeat protein